MKHILSIVFSHDLVHFDEIISFNNENYRLSQYGVNFNIEAAIGLIEKYDGEADVIAFSGIPPAIRYKGGLFIHPTVERLKGHAKQSVVVDGHTLKNVYIPWTLRKFHQEHPHYFSRKKVAFYSGALNRPLLEVLSEFDCSFCLGDPYFFARMPFNLKSSEQLDYFIKLSSPFFKNIELKKTYLSDFDNRKVPLPKHLFEFFDSDIFVAHETTLRLLDLEHLQGKTILLDFCGPELMKRLKEVQVRDVLVCMPRMIDHPGINFSVLEAVLMLSSNSERRLTENEVLKWIDQYAIKTELKTVERPSDTGPSKFAFIVHPLGVSHIFKHPLLKFLSPYSKQLGPLAEDIVARTPGFFYGTIKGVRSEKNGKEVEGLIYTVTETPRKLLEKNPATVYNKLINLCHKARDKGALIIGLGAYTKIVGDAGVTVANQSPIPVTTGNSLSACATLWAAKWALERLNFVKRNPVTRMYEGKCMVIGATGSIGAVSAKVLAKQWKHLVLVAPRAYKLLELRDEIREIAPHCQIDVATTPESHARDCDLIITTTSSRGEKILDIMSVRPGCVICDVSRPFDIKEADAIKRPDVLVIASGEVQLPGQVKMNVDLGLEGKIVYACLAETALLAMEGKLECFTLGRNISYDNVIEIDRMAHEHGVRLSCVMGHNGFITDEEIALCREHALKALPAWSS
ncbi:MAG: serine carboxypeptidase [Bacteriovoracaceae bacterium]